MRRLLRPWLLITVAALVVVAVVVVVLVNDGGTGSNPAGPTSATNPTQGVASDKPAKITASDGVKLGAEVITPTGAGPFPLLVMPAAWGAQETQYTKIGRELASHGYQIVAYTQRGFKDSGGQVDFAGLPTQQDVSTVIDWALKNTHADQDEIGMVGVSYGGGMSLLGAERDPRIKAVAALSTWADFDYAFYPNDTLATQSLQALLSSASGRSSTVVTQLEQDFTKNATAGVALLSSLSALRSARTDVAALNQRHVPVMMANAYEDSIFQPSPLISFFDSLTGPKRLQLAVGDHGGPEAAGLEGQTNTATWNDVESWFDHYLRGKATGIDKDDPIQLQDATTSAWHGYSSWPSTATTYDLGTPGKDGTLSTSPSAWTSTITAGTDTNATSGNVQYARGGAQYAMPSADISGVDTSHGFEWQGPALTSPLLVSGSPHVSYGVSSPTGGGTLFAYLYDVDGSGTGKLMSVTPYTARTGGANVTKTVDYDLQPISWTVPAGDHLALVVDTVDPRWLALNTKGTKITASSTAATPATLSVPTP